MEHGSEEIIFFGLYVDDEGSLVADAANTRVHFEGLLTRRPCAENDYFSYYTNEWCYECLDYALHLFEPIYRRLSAHSRALGSDDKI